MECDIDNLENTIVCCCLGCIFGALKSTVVNARFVKREINRSEKLKQIGLVVWGAFLSVICFLLLLKIVDWIFR